MNELSLTWLLAVPALAFAVGWFSARMDLRQWRRAERDSPRAYYKGLNLLLNEQQDKAIDAFIEAVQNDPDTTELHFALGNLFRRRGEFERSVRVHQHLLLRADLSAADRDRAQHALAQDYAKAGLFDRAEEAYRALEHSAFAAESHRALLDLYERSREWPLAREMAEKLEAAGAGSYAVRRSHHLCEEALQARREPGAQDKPDVVERITALLQRARDVAPQAARPIVEYGQWMAQCGRASQALGAWQALLQLPGAPVGLVAQDIEQCVEQHGAAEVELRGRAIRLLQAAYEAQPSLPVLQALNTLRPEGAAAALQAHLARQPSLSAAAAVMRLPASAWQEHSLQQVQQALDRSSRPLQRYRCAACGFEAQRYFWQCPGCLSWDSYPAQRVEDL